MRPLRLFIDTHDKRTETFPDGLTREQFAAFFSTFESACRDEGVVILRSHVGLGDGRAFCLTMAPDADAVRRAHDRVGLPFDDITEVEIADPADTLLRAAVPAG
ncbi:DUF4242 domain-containing protein [Rhodoplanes azumiensis]|uniref:DUF4242 domain-containing protein n=1 Tax=Rhodoplanes azumiensis TaxID=1897628 RepID=A0ABW5AEP3_9BRAD